MSQTSAFAIASYWANTQRESHNRKLIQRADFWQLLLTELCPLFRLFNVEVRLKPETESRLNELASKSGRPTDDLVEDAMAGYLSEAAELRNMLDNRYDEIKSGRVKPIDGETFFETLRQREDELLKGRPPK